ncbi:MAG: hypothetical protein ABII01_05695 [Candidatus Woesearchaeota archaeon]
MGSKISGVVDDDSSGDGSDDMAEEIRPVELDELLAQAEELIESKGIRPRNGNRSSSPYKRLSDRSDLSFVGHHGIAQAYIDSGSRVNRFGKNNTRVMRRLVFENMQNPVGKCFRGYQMAASYVAGRNGSTNLYDLVSAHVGNADQLRLDFQGVLLMCESHLEELSEYGHRQLDRVGNLIDERDKRKSQGNGISYDSLIHASQSNGDLSPQQRVRLKKALFDLKAVDLEQGRAMLNSSIDLAYTDWSSDIVSELYTHMHNLGTACQNICTSLERMTDHLGVVLPGFVYGIQASKEAVNMDRTLKLLGGFSQAFFNHYMQGSQQAMSLFNMQPLGHLYSHFNRSLRGMNDKTLGSLAETSANFDRLVEGRGYVDEKNE